MKAKPLFETEAAMCDAFMAWARDEGFTPYPETAGWDILLVGADGTQVGVQAKLKLNLAVLAQTMPSYWFSANTGAPDFRAVLVGDSPNRSVDDLCAAMGVAVVRPEGHHWRTDRPHSFHPGLRHADRLYGGWHFWNPDKRCELPAYIPDVRAGIPAPVQLTVWKIAALRIVATLEIRGYVTRSDFSIQKLDHRRWIGPDGWLAAGTEPGRYVGTAEAWKLRDQHPVVYQQIREEMGAKDWLAAPDLLGG